MRILSSGVLSVLLLMAAFSALWAQDADPPPPPQDQFFSGTVTAINDSSVTVTRTVLGKESAVRTFVITPETAIDGKPPKLKAKVTVRYITGDSGDRAVRIIMRGSVPAPAPKKQ